MKDKLIYLLLLVFTMCNPLISEARILSETANYAEEVKFACYEEVCGTMMLYAFFTSTDDPHTGSLLAQTTDSQPADFEWYVFDFNSKTLASTPFATENNVTISRVNNLVENGYMVKITQNGVIDTSMAWVFLDELKINSITHDNTCDYLRLVARPAYRTNYEYYNFSDLLDPEYRIKSNVFRMRWSASKDIRAGIEGTSNLWQNVTSSVSTVIDSPGPLVDAEYTVEMTNVFGNKAKAETQTIPYMAVYAATEILRPDESGFFVPTKNLTGEALYKVKFNSKSVNATVFEWKGYGNQLINFEKDKVLWTETSENISRVFEYIPGEYLVNLDVKNTRTGCTSSTLKSDKLVVEPSSISPESMPNAFTPNGDGRNDYFKFVEGKEPVSLYDIDLKIFNRNNLLVYKYKGSSADWKGWDGKFMGDGGDCPTGVYYYVISAKGWDDVSYSGKSFTGTLHIFR